MRGVAVVVTALAGALALAANAGALVGHARAQEAAARAPAAAVVHRARVRSSERAVPDYDGRAEPSTTAGEVLLWIPRVVFAPLYLVTEYLLRRPLGWLATAAERADLPALIIDFVSPDGPRTAGVVPSVLFDYGLLPSVGLYIFWDDVGVRGHDLRARVATWGIDSLTVALADRVRLSQRSRMTLKADFSRRSDWLFFGLGPDASPDDLSRYSSRSFDLGLSFDAEPWRSSSVRWYAGWRDAAFESDVCCSDRAVGEVHSPLPPGLADGYSVWLQRMTLALDTRGTIGAASGVRVELRGEQGFELSDPARRRWIKYGGLVGAFLDLGRRVVGLSLSAHFAEPLSGSELVPFTEQVTLGGAELMRGFLPGRLVDTSAIAVTLEYRWPVWVWLDGLLQISVGNVLPGHLDGLSLDRMRLSATLGVRSASRTDHSFDFLIGIGTEPFDGGFELSSFRLLIGTKDGF